MAWVSFGRGGVGYYRLTDEGLGRLRALIANRWRMIPATEKGRRS